MKKNRIATVIIALAIGITGLGLTGCGETGPNANFTGTAIAKSHHKASKSCYIKVAYPDGSEVSRRVGTRTKCYSVKDGGKVVFENGHIKSFDRK